MENITKTEGDYKTKEHLAESEDSFPELEPLEDLDDAEFGLPPIDQPPSLEDILAADENEELDEFLEDEIGLEASGNGHILRDSVNYQTAYDGNNSGSSSVGGGSAGSGQGALFRHLGLFAGSSNNDETLSVHSRGSHSIGQTSATESLQSSVLLHNMKKAERSKASIMRYIKNAWNIVVG